MLFSICIPAYNCEKYISRCLDSVVAQEFNDYEIIVVDDGSTDNTGEIIDEYANKFAFVRALHTENKGEIMTRAQLVSLAQGEYCVFVDSDDYVDNGILKKLEAIINIREQIDCIVFGFRVVDQTGNEKLIIKEDETSLIDDKESLYEKVFAKSEYNSMWRKCTRTEILKTYNRASDNKKIFLGGDLLHSLHIYKNSKEILFIKDILYNYVENDQSVTHTISHKKFQPSYVLADKVYTFLREENYENSNAMSAAQIHYIGSLIQDIFLIEGFSITKNEKIALVKDLFEKSKDTLQNNLKNKDIREKLGKRYVIYVAIKNKMFSLAISLVRLANFARK